MLFQTQDPTKPVITSVGHAQAGGVADSTAPVITGSGDPGNIIMVYDGIRFLGTVTVALNGTWTLTPTVALKAGSHSFTVIAQDSEGNRSASSEPFSSTVPAAAVVPNPPSISDVTDAVGPVQGPVPNGGVTDDSHPTIHGAGDPGSKITVYDGTTPLGTATVGTDGKWSFQPAAALADGPHGITATETTAGGTSGPSNKMDFTVDTSATAAPTITQVLDAVGAVTGAVPSGGTTDDTHPTISGKGVKAIRSRCTTTAARCWARRSWTPTATGR